MKKTDAEIFRCPSCGTGVRLKASPAHDEVVEGALVCGECHREYPVVRSIPRFVSSENYAASFGFQWQAYARTQVGGAQKIISKIRFDATTKWPAKMEGELILEAGCGAGRFSEIALDTGAEVYSFDLSEAVEANIKNITDPGQKKRHHLFQASIYEIPLPLDMFDRIYCMGVLQHCPDVKQAFLSLIPHLRPGGEIVVDCYLSQPLKHAFNLKYRLRPFFKWWKPPWLFMFWTAVISMAYDLKLFLSKIPLMGQGIAKIVPIGKLNYEPEFHFTVDELKEIKTLSVFDMLSPRFDQPQKLSVFRAWMEEGGLEILELTTGYNGINARGRRKG